MLQRIPSSRVLLNYAIRTIGHKDIRAPMDIWKQLGSTPYTNNLFRVEFDKEKETVNFKTDPWRSTHLMLGIKYIPDGVALEAPLIKDGDSYVLSGDITNLPARWLDMLYEYSLKGLNYNPYTNNPICDPDEVQLVSNQDDEFADICQDYELAMVVKYDLDHCRDPRCETIAEMNECYGDRFPLNFSDTDFNRCFYDVSTRSDLFPYRLQIMRGPVATRNDFTDIEYTGRIVNVNDKSNKQEWVINDCSASPSTALFVRKCRSAPNDYNRYGCDVATFGGGIKFPLSTYRLASMIISNMQSPNHPQYPLNLDMDDNFHPVSSITAEDLVVLGEDVKNSGGEYRFTM